MRSRSTSSALAADASSDAWALWRIVILSLVGAGSLTMYLLVAATTQRMDPGCFIEAMYVDGLEPWQFSLDFSWFPPSYVCTWPDGSTRRVFVDGLSAVAAVGCGTIAASCAVLVAWLVTARCVRRWRRVRRASVR